MSVEVRFPREIREGMKGGDVVAHKRAISRARPDLYQWTEFTEYAGDFFMDAVVKWKKSKGLGTTRVLGGRAHEALERTHREGYAGQWAFDALAVQFAEEYWQKVSKTPEQRMREAIVAAGFFWYERRYQIAYSQYRPFQLGKPPWTPSRLDCSGFVTNCYFAGGAPNPNAGQAYESRLGYTGTLIGKGTVVTRDQLKPGDLAFYGSSWGKPGFPQGSPTHVALYVGVFNGQQRVLSLGSSPMGFYSLTYRALNHLRSYL